MLATTGITKKVWTEEELQALPDDGYLHEVVNGELSGEHLLPGFRFPVADLFKEWDWE